MMTDSAVSSIRCTRAEQAEVFEGWQDPVFWFSGSLLDFVRILGNLVDGTALEAQAAEEGVLVNGVQAVRPADGNVRGQRERSRER